MASFSDNTSCESFAEIIIPLPIYSTFTYSVPDEMLDELNIGSRVLVPFGKKKFYTGIVCAVNQEKPTSYDVKPIAALLDPEPVIRYPQLRHWQWIADYYLCTPGDVFKAAVPTGLKPESETTISLNPGREPDDYADSLTEYQAMVYQSLDSAKKMKISDLEKELKIKNPMRVINSMLDKKILMIDERLVEKYHSHKVSMVEICADKGDNDRLHEFFGLISRSPRQEKTLIAYLELSRWLDNRNNLQEVSREQLTEKSGATPAIIKSMADKGIFRIVKKSVNRFNTTSPTPSEITLSPLSSHQQQALEAIRKEFTTKNVCLLHGITGSGKTEIYTHLIQTAVNDNNQVLYLVPEISLTTQLTDRLRKVFGNRLLVYHSRFSDNERVDIWKKILHTHEPLIILGARSSVFLPFAHLGLVIIDEEHEASFKQYDPAPRYNARDAAIVLASMHGAKTLLGSATPSVETYYKATNGKYGLVCLDTRYEGSKLPEVEIVDMKQQRRQKENHGIISSTLRRITMAALKEGSQAIMFQNRRGFAPVVVCRLCGWTPKCENCDVALVYHKHSGELRCHYCGSSRSLPAVCPACGDNGIEIYGYGTERIAEEMHSLFQDYRVSRMDLDTTRNKNSYQEIIDEFSRHETDILVGTQMISKGLDFGDVSVVGVLNADTLLNFPDFRSNERAFNMLEQVAGRAGRRNKQGKVIIQTTDPANDILAHVRHHDYYSYYRSEIAGRRRFCYPPFSRIINIYIKNRDAATADSIAVSYAMTLRSVFGNRVLGPEKPFVSRVATWYVQQIMLKIEAEASMKKVKDILRTIFESMSRDSRMKSSQIYYDVDPA